MIGDISGRPCPRCGCKDTRVVGEVIAFGHTTEQYSCRHCGRRFSPPLEQILAAAGEATEADVPDEIEYLANCRCPKCAARNPAVKSTQKKGTATVRYHRCECGYRFRSVEPGRV